MMQRNHAVGLDIMNADTDFLCRIRLILRPILCRLFLLIMRVRMLKLPNACRLSIDRRRLPAAAEFGDFCRTAKSQIHFCRTASPIGTCCCPAGMLSSQSLFS
jgi:hypothetical protein